MENSNSPLGFDNGATKMKKNGVLQEWHGLKSSCGIEVKAQSEVLLGF